MGRDLGAGADAETVGAAIAGLGPAIELVDVIFPPEDVEEILAADIFHRHVVLGACDAGRAGARLDGMTGRVRRNGEEMATVADLEANTGRILDLVRQIADSLAGAGETLRAGEVVICGSITPPIFPDAGDRELRYALDPLGEISVRFA
jgi:2-keto-4-pentenoate hydratase